MQVLNLLYFELLFIKNLIKVFLSNVEDVRIWEIDGFLNNDLEN